MKIKILLKRIYLFFLKLITAFIIVSVFFVVLYRFIPPPVTPLMIIRLAENVAEGDFKFRKDWEPIKNISPNLIMAVIASEDQNFVSHFGLDFDAIEKARGYNSRKKGKKIRGASTITQQTAKNLFLWPGRSWLRKGFEVYFTLLIEIFWTKKRIMEVYLNIIEMGDGIYGAEAASMAYFNKGAGRLTISEAALMAASLPNPRRWSPVNPTNYLTHRQRWIIKNINNLPKPDFL